MENHQHPRTPAPKAEPDHFKMKHNAIKHDSNPAPGHEGHNHQAMIDDSKNVFT